MGDDFKRRFQDIELSPTVMDSLTRAHALGKLSSFRIDGNTVEVKRPFVEGSTVDTAIKSFSDPLDFSRDLFAAVLHKLEPLHRKDIGHGAIHPGNVLVGPEPRIELVDVVANQAYLGVRNVSGAHPYTIWLWATAVPPTLTLREWDLICLVRMCALLVEGFEKAQDGTLDACLEWAEKTRQIQPPGADVGERLAEIATILEKTSTIPLEPQPSVGIDHGPPPARPPPPEPQTSENAVEALLKTVAARADGRMLRESHEHRVVESATRQGMNRSDVDQQIRVWLLQNGWRKEGDLRREAASFLTSGTYPGSSLVKENAVRNACRSFTQFEVPEAESVRIVSVLLKSQGLRNEREVTKKWRPAIDDFVRANCSKQKYTTSQFSEMRKQVENHGVPDEIADRVLKKYLKEKGLKQKTGLFS